jgi:D-alanyl-D-alanine carboxypeptidase (penicillin-binding protein 5/6)
MSSPLQGGARRRRTRRSWLLFFVVPIAAIAAWLVVSESSTSDTVNAPVKPLAGDIGTSTRPPPGGNPRRGTPPPGITLLGAKHVRLKFHDPPRAGLLFDLKSGQVLWAHRPLRPLPIASLTKIMTAILVVERTRPEDRARVTKEALAYQGSGVGVLPKHKLVPVEGLMHGMLLPSGNDAALALADHVAGTDKRFVKLMNARARTMGLGCTHYASADGIEDSNRSCAADLAALAREAISKRRIARIVRKPTAKVRFPIKTGYLYVNTTNPLLHDGFPGTIGLKTGSTDKAGHCFVGVVKRGRRTLGVVLLHSPNPLSQSEKLLTAGFKLRP